MAVCAPPRLILLQGFDLQLAGRSMVVTPASQRLLALLALSPGWQTRHEVSAVLWPDSDERRAAANLRSAIWRLPQPTRCLVDSDGGRIRLSPDVCCDVAELLDRIRLLSDPGAAVDAGLLDVRPLLHDLLSSWYDDWVLVEREKLRRRRIGALDALCERLTSVGRYGEAIDAGLAAVSAEPLREHSHRLLVLAHLAEGNHSEAFRQYDLYVSMLLEDLGTSPSVEMGRLIEGLRLV